jgi:hypothetical protein
MFSAGTAFSQSSNYGLLAGINYSRLHSDESTGYFGEPQIGIVLGGYYSQYYESILGIQPEILYSYNTFGYSSTIVPNVHKVNIDTHNLVLSFLLKARAKAFLNSVPEFFIGPSVKLNLNNKMTISTLEKSENDVISDYNKINLGLLLGLGIITENISITATYLIDLEGISKS